MKRLALGVFLILAAAAVLLVSDWQARTSAPSGVPRIAIMQHVSQGIIDEGVAGMIQALTDAGFSAPKTLDIQRFNAEGDTPTANAIAKQIVSSKFDLVLTATTLSLQAVAGANQTAHLKHVFGLVSDPVGAGVGIRSFDSPDHPAHLTGIGTMPPVKAAFEVARELYPALKRVGTAFNPAESNSVASMQLGRAVANELGIELLEATVDNSSAAGEAISSLVSRGADAIWVGTDVALITAIDSVIAAARRGRVPVFTSVPGNTARGALFDVGANYTEVGQLTGALAAQILQGANPADIPVRNVIPERLLLNNGALADLKSTWRIPDALAARAAAMAAPPKRSLAKKWNIQIVELNNVLDVEEAEHGIFKGFEEQQLVRGKDFDATVRNAQGDMATLNGLVDAAIGDGADLLMTLSTPTLQAALQRAKGKVPIVFTYVADAVAAGAGKSDSDHLPNVTGVQTLAAHDEMVAIVRQLLPSAKTIGSLFVPAEVNMVTNRELLATSAQKAGLTLIASGVATSTEIADGALALTSRGIDALVQIPGNMTAAAFGGIAQAAKRKRLPVFAFQKAQARQGAMVALARDYEDAGRQAAEAAARVMRGENPAKMPFAQIRTTRLIINKGVAQTLGITIPSELMRKAVEVIE
ncbi:MAG: ABC transporter substrate-binding protein [Vicinamibacterales bacterium]